MLVCICNAIRERDVVEAVGAGAQCPRSAYACLGKRAKCGQCVPYAKEVIERQLRALPVGEGGRSYSIDFATGGRGQSGSAWEASAA